MATNSSSIQADALESFRELERRSRDIERELRGFDVRIATLESQRDGEAVVRSFVDEFRNRLGGAEVVANLIAEQRAQNEAQRAQIDTLTRAIEVASAQRVTRDLTIRDIAHYVVTLVSLGLAVWASVRGS